MKSKFGDKVNINLLYSYRFLNTDCSKEPKTMDMIPGKYKLQDNFPNFRYRLLLAHAGIAS